MAEWSNAKTHSKMELQHQLCGVGGSRQRIAHPWVFWDLCGGSLSTQRDAALGRPAWGYAAKDLLQTCRKDVREEEV